MSAESSRGVQLEIGHVLSMDVAKIQSDKVYNITVNDLKYRWEWDPVRDDPRFQKLIGQASQ